MKVWGLLNILLGLLCTEEALVNQIDLKKYLAIGIEEEAQTKAIGELDRQNNQKGIYYFCATSRGRQKTLKLFHSKWHLYACATFENSLMSCGIKKSYLKILK